IVDSGDADQHTKAPLDATHHLAAYAYAGLAHPLDDRTHALGVASGTSENHSKTRRCFPSPRLICVAATAEGETLRPGDNNDTTTQKHRYTQSWCASAGRERPGCSAKLGHAPHLVARWRVSNPWHPSSYRSRRHPRCSVARRWRCAHFGG